MSTKRTALAAALTLGLSAGLSTGPACADELVYGTGRRRRNTRTVVMPELIKTIEKETNGAIKWKLIAGGQSPTARGPFRPSRMA